MEANFSWKKILKFSLPVTLIGVFDLVLVWIDFFWVYFLIGDADALAGIRVSSSFVMLIEAVLVAVVSSLLIYISQHVGAKEMDQAKRGIRGAFSFSIYGGLVVTILGLIFLPTLINIFGVNDSTVGYTKDYFSIYLVGYIVMSLNNLLLLLPRYFHKLKVIYQSLTIAAVLNIVLTPILMLGFQELGLPLISGAACATILANVGCALYLFWKIFMKDYLSINLSSKDVSLRIDYKLLLENKEYIGSQIFTGITFNLSMFLYILILSYYPSEAFNVYAVASYIFAFFGILANNFAASLFPMVSQHVGAKEYDAIRDLVKKILLVIFSYGGGIAILIMAGHSLIANILALDSSLVPLFSQFILLYAIPWALNLAATVFIFVVAASGDSKGSMTLTIVNMYVIVLLCMLTLPNLFTNVTTGVFFTLGIIQVLTFIFSAIYYLTGRWTKASLVRISEETVEA